MTEVGAAARIQPERGQERCAFCCDDALEKVLERNGGEYLTKSLKAFLAFGDEEIFDLAVTNLRQRRGFAFADSFAARAHKAKERQARGPGEPKLSKQQQWSEVLAYRLRAQGALDDAAMEQYQKVVNKDRSLVRRKFFCPHMMKKHKRPARNPYPSERCLGHQDGTPCRFSLTERGVAARIQPERGQERCAFCCDDTLEAVLARNGGEHLTKSLKAFLAFGDEEIFDLAVANLRQRRGDAFADNFAARAHKAKERQARGPGEPKLSKQQQWGEALAYRVRAQGGLADATMEQYQKVVNKDRSLVRRKFFCPHMMKKHYTEANAALEADAMPAPAADVLPNDAGLPATRISDRAAAAEQWCKQAREPRGPWAARCTWLWYPTPKPPKLKIF